MQRPVKDISTSCLPSRSPCFLYASHVPFDSPIAALLIEPLRDLKGVGIHLCNSMNHMVCLLNAENVRLT